MATASPHAWIPDISNQAAAVVSCQSKSQANRKKWQGTDRLLHFEAVADLKHPLVEVSSPLFHPANLRLVSRSSGTTMSEIFFDKHLQPSLRGKVVVLTGWPTMLPSVYELVADP